MFLNPDVSISIEQVLQFLNGAVEQRLDVASPNINQSGYQKPIPTFWSLIHEFTPLGKIIPFSPKKRTLFGGCLLIKKRILEKVGGWDERFFVWFEDSDLTKRLYDNNYRVGWIDSEITHSGAESFKIIDPTTQSDMFFHSMRMYMKKHFLVFQQLIIEFIIQRYSNKKLLPVLDDSISIVVPNMKRALLDSFLKLNCRFIKPPIELVIVTSILSNYDFFTYKRDYPLVRFIRISENRGFASTVNVGLKISRGQWTGTANDDTVWTSNWILQCLDNAPVRSGSINPLIFDREGSVESAGIQIFPQGKATPITILPTENITTIDATNGAAVVYKHEVLENVGLYDERFGSYLEDVDLSLSITKLGYTNCVVTNAKITHLKHQTTLSRVPVFKSWNDFKNWILIIAKNWDAGSIITNFPPILIERGRNLSGVIKSLFERSR